MQFPYFSAISDSEEDNIAKDNIKEGVEAAEDENKLGLSCAMLRAHLAWFGLVWLGIGLLHLIRTYFKWNISIFLGCWSEEKNDLKKPWTELGNKDTWSNSNLLRPEVTRMSFWTHCLLSRVGAACAAYEGTTENKTNSVPIKLKFQDWTEFGNILDMMVLLYAIKEQP